jgi:hypothetical protein
MTFKHHSWLLIVPLLLALDTRAADQGASPQESSPPLFQWRKDPRFATFAPNPALPQMIALDKTKVQIEAVLTLDISALSSISDQDQNVLAKLLNLPQTACSNCLASLATHKITDAEILIKELRTYATDYRFLLHVWNEFVSLEQASPKKEARTALASGDLEKAWQLYPTPTGDHPKPPPPTGLRVVKHGEENPPPGK